MAVVRMPDDGGPVRFGPDPEFPDWEGERIPGSPDPGAPCWHCENPVEPGQVVVHWTGEPNITWHAGCAESWLLSFARDVHAARSRERRRV
jgi:hypothetical protein